jgi:hypothetical protein
LYGQQSIFDRPFPSNAQIKTSLAVLQRISSFKRLTVKEILEVYVSEKVVGRCIWSEYSGPPSLAGSTAPINWQFVDSALGTKCLLYVQEHKDRFRVVGDGWKGEDNFVEPNRYWDSVAQHLSPNSPATNEISFDLDFKDLIRRYHIDLDAAGKTCDQYSKEIFQNADAYLEVYSWQEMQKWPAECAQTRDNFERERGEMLNRYGNAPFTNILRDIDTTTIVVFHSVC